MQYKMLCNAVMDKAKGTRRQLGNGDRRRLDNVWLRYFDTSTHQAGMIGYVEKCNTVSTTKVWQDNSNVPPSDLTMFITDLEPKVITVTDVSANQWNAEEELKVTPQEDSEAYA